MTRRPALRLSMVAAPWAALLLWALLAHPSAPARPDLVAALLVAAAAFLVAAGLGRLAAWLPGLLVAAGITAVLLTTRDVWSGRPTGPPLGYGNANGMLVVGAVAGLLLAGSAARSWWLRLLAAVLTLPGLLASYELTAQAALLACALLLAWYAVHRLGRPTTWVALAVLGTAAAWAATVWWALRPSRTPGPVLSALSEERIELWRDAVRITREFPLAGAGPGRFPDLSRTAQDPDLAWTHSTPLQLSAELGLVGAGLFALLVLALLVAAGRWAPVVAIVLLPTTIDYVLDFPWVVVVVSAVAGAVVAVVGTDSPRAAAASASVGTGNPTLTPPAP